MGKWGISRVSNINREWMCSILGHIKEKYKCRHNINTSFTCFLDISWHLPYFIFENIDNPAVSGGLSNEHAIENIIFGLKIILCIFTQSFKIEKKKIPKVTISIAVIWGLFRAWSTQLNFRNFPKKLNIFSTIISVMISKRTRLKRFWLNGVDHRCGLNKLQKRLHEWLQRGLQIWG